MLISQQGSIAINAATTTAVMAVGDLIPSNALATGVKAKAPVGVNSFAVCMFLSAVFFRGPHM